MKDNWWQCALIEVGGSRHELGAVRADTREDAIVRTQKKFKNLIGKLETGRFSIEATRTQNPPALARRSRRIGRDSTPDILVASGIE